MSTNRRRRGNDDDEEEVEEGRRRRRQRTGYGSVADAANAAGAAGAEDDGDEEEDEWFDARQHHHPHQQQQQQQDGDGDAESESEMTPLIRNEYGSPSENSNGDDEKGVVGDDGESTGGEGGFNENTASISSSSSSPPQQQPQSRWWWRSLYPRRQQQQQQQRKHQQQRLPAPPLRNLLLFEWFLPVLNRGNSKQRLDQSDLNLVEFPDDCSARDVVSKFDEYWRQELELLHRRPEAHRRRKTTTGNSRDRRDRQPSLVRALWRSFGKDFVRAGALKLVHDLCAFVGPQVLRGMIEYLRSGGAPDHPTSSSASWRGLGLTAAVTASQLAMSLCLRHYFFKVRCYRLVVVTRTVGDGCASLVLAGASRAARYLQLPRLGAFVLLLTSSSRFLRFLFWPLSY